MEPDNISPQPVTAEELARFRALVESTLAALRPTADGLPVLAPMAVSFYPEEVNSR